jgi:hypothetical protein
LLKELADKKVSKIKIIQVWVDWIQVCQFEKILTEAVHEWNRWILSYCLWRLAFLCHIVHDTLNSNEFLKRDPSPFNCRRITSFQVAHKACQRPRFWADIQQLHRRTC